MRLSAIVHFKQFSNSIPRCFATNRFAKAVLLVLLASMACLSQAAPIIEARSKVGLLSALSLPPEMASLVDYALSEDGMLFVADKHAVWIWSPWGWERIWTLLKTADSSSQKINAIAVVKDAQNAE